MSEAAFGGDAPRLRRATPSASFAPPWETALGAEALRLEPFDDERRRRRDDDGVARCFAPFGTLGWGSLSAPKPDVVPCRACPQGAMLAADAVLQCRPLPRCDGADDAHALCQLFADNAFVTGSCKGCVDGSFCNSLTGRRQCR